MVMSANYHPFFIYDKNNFQKTNDFVIQLKN